MTGASGDKPFPQILREYLYVDTTRVRSMLAQQDEGVIERSVSASRDHREGSVGFRQILGYARNWGDDTEITKSLGDLMFPALEAGLEATGFLSDVSDIARDTDRWRSGQLESEYPAGSIVRVSAPANLFDARYLAQTFAGSRRLTAACKALVRCRQSNRWPVKPCPEKGVRNVRRSDRRRHVRLPPRCLLRSRT